MNRKYRIVLIACALCVTASAGTPIGERGAWFREARFGMFIHWGIYSIPKDKGGSMLYESPATTNDSWGYKPHDQNWKSAERIRRDREHLASIGANYLLNVGPDGLGRIPTPAVDAILSAAKEQGS